MNFLPSDEREPTKSNYMKFVDGTNTFRVLGSSLIGWEYWTEVVVEGEKRNKPVRVNKEDSIPLDEIVLDQYGNLNVHYFWAFPVYNFTDERIQILVVKQKTVRKGMKKHIDNKKWGDPKEYNFEVTRSKTPEGRIEYVVIAEPKDKIDPKILNQYKDMKLDMQVWMDGGDPFESQEEKDAREAFGI